MFSERLDLVSKISLSVNIIRMTTTGGRGERFPTPSLTRSLYPNFNGSYSRFRCSSLLNVEWDSFVVSDLESRTLMFDMFDPSRS